jgi:hypothetical protein
MPWNMSVCSLLEGWIPSFFSPHFCVSKKHDFREWVKCLERTGLMDRKKGSWSACCRYSLASSSPFHHHFLTPRRKAVKTTNTSTWFSPGATYRRGVQLHAGLMTT